MDFDDVPWLLAIVIACFRPLIVPFLSPQDSLSNDSVNQRWRPLGSRSTLKVNCQQSPPLQKLSISYMKTVPIIDKNEGHR